jgi:hypothetical protein
MAVAAELVHWLLEDSDPSVRFRTYEGVLGRSAGDGELEAARADIGHTGWAERIMALQLPEGQWDSPGTSSDELYWPKYIATNWRLLVLADLGLTRSTPAIDRAIRLVLGRWGGPDGCFGGAGSETCITGNALRLFWQVGASETPEADGATQWLVEQQKADGGWHCFPSERGSLDGWEALAAFAHIPRPKRSAAVQRAVERGAEFYLERGLLQENGLSYAPWRRLHYPVHYYYDLLVGLDFLTRLGYARDERLRVPLEILEGLRGADGRWTMGPLHPDLAEEAEYGVRTPYYPFALEPAGVPSRWITLSALRVLLEAGRI